MQAPSILLTNEFKLEDLEAIREISNAPMGYLGRRNENERDFKSNDATISSPQRRPAFHELNLVLHNQTVSCQAEQNSQSELQESSVSYSILLHYYKKLEMFALYSYC